MMAHPVPLRSPRHPGRPRSARGPGALLLLVVSLCIVGAEIAVATGGYYRNAANRHSNTATGVLRDGTLPRGSCNQCHVTHGANDFALFAANDNNLCYTCHTGTFGWERAWTGSANYNASGHGTSTALYNPASGAGTGREVRLCVQCHNPHGNGEAANGFFASLQERLEERTCFSNNTAGTAGTGCHGNVVGYRPTNAVDIYTPITRAFNHTLTMGDPSVTRRHVSTESQATNSGAFSGTNRHVECTDCHNPHLARPGLHTAPTNDASPILFGAWGVEPTFGAAWVVPTVFTAVNFTTWPMTTAQNEYQICLKCHSYFAYGATPPAGYTDQAREFNPNNAAYHMAIAATRSANMYANAVFVAPWTSSSQMYCTDCHASSTAGDRAGPHGSILDNILVAPWTNNTGASTTGGDLCFRCHPFSVYVSGAGANNQTGFYNAGDGNLHRFHMTGQNARCWNCHVRIPHGWQVRHMLSMRPLQPTWPLYYGSAAGGHVGAWVNVTTWRTPGNWTENDCDHTGC